MITDLDEILKQLLIKKAELDPSEVEIAFDIPNREWSASISKPTVNLYLYDIRENRNLRNNEWFTERNGDQATRKKKASRFDLSYLVTVWTNNVEDQHRLLWRVLATLFRYPTIPQELLTGELAAQNYPVITSTAQSEGLFANPADFWSALNNEIKPSINLVVTMPLDLEMGFTAPVVKTTQFAIKNLDAEIEKFLLLKGTVSTGGKNKKALAKAVVVAKEAGMSAETDSEGTYLFKGLSAGKQTFQVLVAGKKVKEIVMTIPSRSYDIET
jgi:hypothetical protein